MALDLSNHTVLVVDDVREMRTSLRTICKSLGAQTVIEAKSGAEAIEQLQTNDIDIVLCDYNLGDGRDGQQVFEEAKEFAMIVPTTVFVMITADNTMDVVMSVVDHSPDGYLVKPLNKSVFELRLEKILHRKRVFKDIDATMRAKDFRKAAAICDLMLKRYPQLRFDLVRMKAEALLKARDIDAVIAICNNVLAEREVPWATLFLGRAHYTNGDVDAARGFFVQAIEQNDALIEAYDWLVRIDRECGDDMGAQKTLERAVKLSPKSIGRQQTLGDLASGNGDHETARKAFHAAVELGVNSVYARIDDQVGLVNAVAETRGPQEALKVLDELQHAKRGTGGQAEATDWRLDLSYAQMLLASEQATKAKSAVGQALQGYQQKPRTTTDGAAIALAKTCYRVGMVKEAKVLMNQIVKENHDREDVIAAVRAMYNELGMEGLGDDLIDTARRAVVDINNRGVSLAKEGKLDEAIELLTQASDELPGNLTISLNVLQAVLSQVRFFGATRQRQFLIDEYLKRSEKINPENPKLVRLREKILEMQSPTDSHVQA